MTKSFSKWIYRKGCNTMFLNLKKFLIVSSVCYKIHRQIRNWKCGKKSSCDQSPNYIHFSYLKPVDRKSYVHFVCKLVISLLTKNLNQGKKIQSYIIKQWFFFYYICGRHTLFWINDLTKYLRLKTVCLIFFKQIEYFSKKNKYASARKMYSFHLSYSSINSGLLTVDGDVYCLNICVNVIDSCALVCPSSLPADRWDFQVLVIRCHISCKRSRT